ncbi:polarized growth protein Boi2 [Aspergillus luchuensis]|nr:polarized growth protein Boi2 [Aspergillus luchuensis]
MAALSLRNRGSTIYLAHLVCSPNSTGAFWPEESTRGPPDLQLRRGEKEQWILRAAMAAVISIHEEENNRTQAHLDHSRSRQ